MRISQEALERDRYGNRLEWQRDQRQLEYDYQEVAAALQAAQAALQIVEAREVESLVVHVQFCEHFLGETPTPKEELASKPVEELRHLTAELEGRIEPGS